ncbi:MAG: PAS domain-containing protein [Proteobacteria bacterium]|nr:PAS domain-containing protein [Pseudomonadota bacterium]
MLAAALVAAIELSFGSLLISAADTPIVTVIYILRLLLIPLTAILVYLLLMEKYRVRQLNFNSDRLETLLKNLPGMAYRCFNSKDWPMEFVSEGCYALCGYERRDLEDQSVLWGSIFTHPGEIKLVEETILVAAGRNEPFEVEYRIITREDEEKWVWERGRVVDSIEGELNYPAAS